jgi:hypothetical protein
MRSDMVGYVVLSAKDLPTSFMIAIEVLPNSVGLRVLNGLDCEPDLLCLIVFI